MQVGFQLLMHPVRQVKHKFRNSSPQSHLHVQSPSSTKLLLLLLHSLNNGYSTNMSEHSSSPQSRLPVQSPSRCCQKEVVIHNNELAAEARNAMQIGLYGVAVEGRQVSRFWEDT
jgi:hypothetical protein